MTSKNLEEIFLKILKTSQIVGEKDKKYLIILSLSIKLQEKCNLIVV